MDRPERLGRYEVRAVLGMGAMGTVYEGWDPELARGVAIKVIQAQHVDAHGLERFRREAHALARLPHTHIVSIHDISWGADTPFIVMELVRGETLAAEIARRADRPLATKVRLAAQICDALAFVNCAGIVHRDVKPGNILITADGDAKLADFGLARLQNSSLTGTANVMGTPAYLAPEGFSGVEVDARADVYGIAASLYEWVSFARPHASDHFATLVAQAMHQDAPDVRDKWPACPAALAECLRRGLARDPNDRYQSANDFGNALRALDLAAANVTPINEAATRVLNRAVGRQPVFKTPGRLSVVAASLAVLILLAAVLIMPRASAPPPLTQSMVADDIVPAGPVPPGPAAESPRATATPLSRGTVAPSPVSSSVPPESAAPSPPQDDEVEVEPPAIPIGTKILVTIGTELRTDRTTRGQFFEASLADPIVWQGREVAAAGTRVQGIVDAVVSGSVEREPSLQLSLLHIEIGGEPVRVRTARYEATAPHASGGPSRVTLIIGVVGGAALGGVLGGGKGAVTGAAIGATAAARAGPSAGEEYVFGNRLTFKLAEPLRLQPKSD